MACWGRCHAPIKSRRDVPDQRRATQQKQVRPNRRQPQRESARRQPESPLAAGRHRAPIQTASLDALAPLCRASRRGLLDIVMSGADDGVLHFEVARLRAWALGGGLDEAMWDDYEEWSAIFAAFRRFVQLKPPAQWDAE